MAKNGTGPAWRTDPVFRAMVASGQIKELTDYCCELLAPLLGMSVEEIRDWYYSKNMEYRIPHDIGDLVRTSRLMKNPVYATPEQTRLLFKLLIGRERKWDMNDSFWRFMNAKGVTHKRDVDTKDFWVNLNEQTGKSRYGLLRADANQSYADFESIARDLLKPVLDDVYKGHQLPVRAIDPFTGNGKVGGMFQKGLGQDYMVLSCDVLDDGGLPAHMAVRRCVSELSILLLLHPPPGHTHGDWLAVEELQAHARKLSAAGSRRPLVVVFLGEMGHSDGTYGMNTYMSTGVWKVKLRVPVRAKFSETFGWITKWLYVFEYNYGGAEEVLSFRAKKLAERRRLIDHQRSVIARKFNEMCRVIEDIMHEDP